MHDAVTGKWIGWGPGDSDPKVADIKAYLRRMYKSYASGLDDSPVYDADLVSVVKEAQSRLGLPTTGLFDYNTQLATGYVKPAPKIKPIYFSVEGHTSDMFAGPVADTGRTLESEGRCHWQPTGYNDGAIPFDNASGENELARMFGQGSMDNGVPFPLGTKYVLAGFSQGAIVVTDFIANYLQPGQVHEPRAKDCLGVLMYGNPCRSTGSVAPWSRAQAGPAANSGMDPKVRLDLLGIQLPYPLMDVYRRGDIFSDNEPGQEGQIKSAIYEAVARADLFSNPYSIAGQIMAAFGLNSGFGGIAADLGGIGSLLPLGGLGSGLGALIPTVGQIGKLPGQTAAAAAANPQLFGEIVAIIKAIVSGVSFLADNPNPHYSPYDISGGINWLRGLLPV